MHRRSSLRGTGTSLVLAALCTSPALAGCSSKKDEDAPAVTPPTDSGATPDSKPAETEPCQEPSDEVKAIRFMPRDVFVAPGETRSVRVYIEPDVCGTQKIPLDLASSSVAKVEGELVADANTAEAMIRVTGVAVGTTTVTAKFGKSTAKLDIDVRKKDAPVCADGGTPAVRRLAPGATVSAQGASLTLQAGAAKDGPSHVEPFDAELGCGPDRAPAGTTSLGPAVTFGPTEKRFLREVVFELPVNPARMPPNAKLKHVRVLYSSTSLKTPRYVPVSNPMFERKGDGFVLRFEAPRLGTYQAVVANDAGTRKRKRHFNHRAVVGFSMGGIGTSMIGMNHHDMFDVLAPLGGPMDATWFLWYFENYHFGGFCSRAPGDPIPTKPCKAPVGEPTEIFEHVQDFEHWWHVNDVGGTGGTFPRSEYVTIFRDVGAMWGNPASENPKFPWVAAGIDKPVPFATRKADYCGDPAKATVAKTGYYDRRYNPDGKLPVIRFCDGATQPGEAGNWAPGGEDAFEIALAVDLNGNGARDEGEPVLVQGHEPYSDVGNDGVASKDEPGYDPVKNPDPAGDDYDPQYNPLGTENNHRRDDKEPFEDVGLDGVVCPAGPKGCPFDTGEGDGKFTMSAGLRRFLDRDGRSQLNGWSDAPPGGKWDDAALDDLDVYADGGIRDLFNWSVVGSHWMSAFSARNRPVTYFNDWGHVATAKIDNSDLFDPKNVDFDALPSSVYLRYGNLDASQRLIEKGDGQHVGYADQVFRRIQTALYFIGSRWPAADRAYVEDPSNPDTSAACEGLNTCVFTFTAKDGRSGPTTIILPPGYHNPASKNVRYPVVYFLHGYGQTPEDLKALALLNAPFMGSGLSSRATRLQKFIMVFVDGRCRGDGDTAECVKGTFYVDSPRSNGPKIDRFFVDLIHHVDATYRTLPPADIEVNE